MTVSREYLTMQNACNHYTPLEDNWIELQNEQIVNREA